MRPCVRRASPVSSSSGPQLWIPKYLVEPLTLADNSMILDIAFGQIHQIENLRMVLLQWAGWSLSWIQWTKPAVVSNRKDVVLFGCDWVTSADFKLTEALFLKRGQHWSSLETWREGAPACDVIEILLHSPRPRPGIPWHPWTIFRKLWIRYLYMIM